MRRFPAILMKVVGLTWYICVLYTRNLLPVPKLPRNISGQDLIRALAHVGYHKTRQKGSHIRLSKAGDGHAITIPDHASIRIGTLNQILKEVADNLGISKGDLLERMGW